MGCQEVSSHALQFLGEKARLNFVDMCMHHTYVCIVHTALAALAAADAAPAAELAAAAAAAVL